MRRFALLLGLMLAGVASAASAQAHAFLGGRVQPATKAPEFWVSNMLADQQWLDVLQADFPVVMHWRVRARKTGLFGTVANKEEWCAVVRHDPVLDEYTVTSQLRGMREQKFGTLDSLKMALGRPLTLPALTPRAPGEYFYDIDLTLQAISLDNFHADARGECTGLESSSGIVGVIESLGRSRTIEELTRQSTVRFTIAR